MKIQLTKISECQNPKVRAATDKSKVAEGLGDESPWVDYAVIGETEEMPETGKSFRFKRSDRNGVAVDGIFTTSNIKAIVKSHDEKGELTHLNLITQNSIYKLEIL